MKVGLLGAWSIDNPGDVVLGLAARQGLAAAMPSAEPVLLAPELPGSAWGHRWTEEQGLGLPIRAVAVDRPSLEGLDAVVVGGGGLISPDPAFRAFLLEGAAVPAAWNAACAQSQAWYHEPARHAVVRDAAERLVYLSVRNRSTERYLRRIGVRAPIAVVPDAALLLQVPEPEAVDREVDAALAEVGLGDRPIVGISVGRAVTDPRTTGFFRELVAALVRLAPEADLLVFPFGGVYGDPALQAPIVRALAPAGGRTLRRSLGPLALWRLIGRLDLYVCTRLHAVIAAFAQEVPFLALDEYLSNETATSKVRELVVDAGLEAAYLSPFLSTAPGWKVAGAWAARGDVDLAGPLAEARSRLAAHYRDLAAALRTTP